MKVIICITFLLLTSLTILSQCNYPSGNYDFSIYHDSRTITIRVRKNWQSEVDSNLIHKFIGIGFGIKWKTKADVVLYKSKSVPPFKIKAINSISRKNDFSFLAYSNSANLVRISSKELMLGEWIVIAKIRYKGNLMDGDRFILTECGFDEATNPYLTQVDKQGNSNRYIPNLVTSEGIHECISVKSTLEIIKPDSVANNLIVEITSTKLTTATFKILNIEGKTIKLTQSDLVAGMNKITINVSELAIGMYMLKVVNGEELNDAQTFQKK